jgi:hypothetical protein
LKTRRLREEAQRKGTRFDALTVKATAKTRAMQGLLAKREHEAVQKAKAEFRVRNPYVLNEYTDARMKQLCADLHGVQRKLAIARAKQTIIVQGAEKF